MTGERPYVVASCAVSVDGHIDDRSEQRLVLSNEADLDRVDDVRAGCDAILVGAETIRRDNPRLLVRSEARRRARVAAGRPASPLKVALTGTGELDPGAAFFAVGDDAGKVVYAASGAVPAAQARVGAVASVVDASEPLDLRHVLADLHARGVRRLLVEGGGQVHTSFLAADLVDELQLAVAPFFVGEDAAPRFVGEGVFPYGPAQRMRLVDARAVGDVVLLRYALGADRFWLREAIELSRRCPPSTSAYAVGAILVDADGLEIARGHSRETDPRDHAEEAALAKVDRADPRLATATLYTSLEPCSTRASRPQPCADLILEAGIPRVVLAWREPAHFVDCHGVEQLETAGVDVVEVPALAAAAREVNAHLFGPA